jgi:hypothetical protein
MAIHKLDLVVFYLLLREESLVSMKRSSLKKPFYALLSRIKFLWWWVIPTNGFYTNIFLMFKYFDFFQSKNLF